MKINKKSISIAMLLPLLLSCGDQIINKGEWISITSTSLSVHSTTSNIVSPFNTSIALKYFKNENKTYSETFDKDLKNKFLSIVSDLHTKFDRHFYYYEDQESKKIVTSVKTINDSYGSGEEIFCSEELYKLIKDGYRLTIDTNGYFNFFIGKLNDYWDGIFHDYNDELIYNDRIIDPLYDEEYRNELNRLTYAVPTLEEVRNLITFNDENKSVIFNVLEDKEYNGELLSRSNKTSLYRPLLTPGGIAKGLLVDYLKSSLLNDSYTDGFINAGSSSLSSLSDLSFTEKGYQAISITDPRGDNPFQREKALTVILYKDYGLSTSGVYTIGKSYQIKDPKDENKIVYRHHIVNPYTGECSQYHASVSLFSSTFSNAELDALSTTFVNLSIEDSLLFKEELLEKYPNHDLKFIMMDFANDDKLKIHIDNELKENVEINATNVEVSYE